jgi:hypothetical protein
MTTAIPTVTAHDVLACLLRYHGDQQTMTMVRAQRLLYFCQAWSLGYGYGALFDNEFHASVIGPRLQELLVEFPYASHLTAWSIKGNPENISPVLRQRIASIVEWAKDASDDNLVGLSQDEAWRAVYQADKSKRNLIPTALIESVYREKAQDLPADPDIAHTDYLAGKILQAVQQDLKRFEPAQREAYRQTLLQKIAQAEIA